MFQEHPCFSTPAGETDIWRFMDLTKFLSMLVRNSLFFCRADGLEDPYEGETPKASRAAFQAQIEAMLPPEPAASLMKMQGDLALLHKTTTFMNCWHMNPTESAAMWKLYASNNEGIAIKTTVRRLRDSLNKWPRPVYIGAVSYNEQAFSHGNALAPFVFKRRSFQHEQELRAVVWLLSMFADMPAVEGEHLQQRAQRLRPLFDGHVSVDLDLLIENLFVAPMSPLWYGELVQSLVDKYGLTKKVERSQLYTLH